MLLVYGIMWPGSKNLAQRNKNGLGFTAIIGKRNEESKHFFFQDSTPGRQTITLPIIDEERISFGCMKTITATEMAVVRFDLAKQSDGSWVGEWFNAEEKGKVRCIFQPITIPENFLEKPN